MAVRHVGLLAVVCFLVLREPTSAFSAAIEGQAGTQGGRTTRLQDEMTRDCSGLADLLAARERNLRSELALFERAPGLAREAEERLRARHNEVRDALARLRAGGELLSDRELALKKRIEDLNKILDALTSKERSRDLHQKDLDFLTNEGLLGTGGFPGGRTPDNLRTWIASLTTQIAEWHRLYGSREQVRAELDRLEDLMAAATADRRGPDGQAQHRELVRSEASLRDKLWEATEKRREAEADLEGLEAEIAAVSAAREAAEQCRSATPSSATGGPGVPADAGWGGNFFGDYTAACSRNGAGLGTGTLGFSMNIDSARFVSAYFQGIEPGISGRVDGEGRVSGSGARVNASAGMKARWGSDPLTLSFSGRFSRDANGRLTAGGPFALGDGAGLTCTGTWQTR